MKINKAAARAQFKKDAAKFRREADMAENYKFPKWVK